jgi:hypothetical protein
MFEQFMPLLARQTTPRTTLYIYVTLRKEASEHKANGAWQATLGRWPELGLFCRALGLFAACGNL